MKTEKTIRTGGIRRGADPAPPTPEQAAAIFAPVLGPRHGKTRAVLRRMATAPPQVLILEGGTAEERLAAALQYAAGLNCSAQNAPCLRCTDCLKIGAGMFPDLFLLDGREESIKIEAVRDLRVVLGEAPRGEGFRVIVLAEAQSLGVEAANALLKSLEEPKLRVCFLLTAPQRERLLPTLVSRGWVVTLPWPLPGTGAPADLADWEQDLAALLETGQGWFARTSVKGGVDAALVRRILLRVQQALAAEPAGRDGGVLGRALAGMSDAGRLHATELIAESLPALEIGVNPTLVLDRVAARLHLARSRFRQT